MRKNANLSQLWNFAFFFNFMSQEYQNEKLPILNGQKKPKTLGKVQKMTVLQAWEIYKMFVNTLYKEWRFTWPIMSSFILVPAGSEYQVYKKSSVNITSDTSEAPSDIVTHSADDGVHTVTDNSPVIANYESQSLLSLFRQGVLIPRRTWAGKLRCWDRERSGAEVGSRKYLHKVCLGFCIGSFMCFPNI